MKALPLLLLLVLVAAPSILLVAYSMVFLGVKAVSGKEIPFFGLITQNRASPRSGRRHPRRNLLLFAPLLVVEFGLGTWFISGISESLPVAILVFCGSLAVFSTILWLSWPPAVFESTEEAAEWATRAHDRLYRKFMAPLFRVLLVLVALTFVTTLVGMIWIVIAEIGGR